MIHHVLAPILLDSSPLIYLAKIEALGAAAGAGYQLHITPAILDETTREAIAYSHPDALVIARAVERQDIAVVTPTQRELLSAEQIRTRAAGLHAGECQVLSVALARRWPAVFHERQAERVARALNVTTVHPVGLLFAGTPDPDLLASRIRRFGGLVDMRTSDIDALLERVERRRR